jgi:UDP-N-acetylglucosamine transferase subunit ALG13
MIIVGSVFTVEDQTRAILVPRDSKYNHHQDNPKIRPGMMMIILIMKA